MAELGERLARGEQAAFAELYDLCADRLHPFLVATLRSRADADDVVQETFVRLARTRAALAEVENFTAYVFAVARNEALRLLERRGREPAPLPAGDLFDLTEMDDGSAAEMATALLAALAELPPEQRIAVELKTHAGLTFREMAEVLDTPQGTLATRYRTALARLRELLTRRCHDR